MLYPGLPHVFAATSPNSELLSNSGSAQLSTAQLSSAQLYALSSAQLSSAQLSTTRSQLSSQVYNTIPKIYCRYILYTCSNLSKVKKHSFTIKASSLQALLRRESSCGRPARPSSWPGGPRRRRPTETAWLPCKDYLNSFSPGTEISRGEDHSPCK